MALKLDFDELPKSGIEKLYKFKKFDDDGWYKDILKNGLWLSSRTELNDPDDCRVPYDFELCSEDQMKSLMFSLLPENLPGLTKIQIVENQYRERKSNPDLYKKFANEFIDNRIGVVSFTKDFNEYMWKEYADDNKGFCVEFDAMGLFKLFEDRFQSTGRRIFIFKIQYVEKLPVVNPCIASLDEKSQLFRFKTKKWSIENEWRAVCFEKSKVLESIDVGCIKKIYFGSNCIEKNILIAKELLKKSNTGIEIFKMKAKNEANTLEFDPIPLE